MTYPSNKSIHKACYEQESHCIENKENEGTPIVGKVTGGLGTITANTPTRLPLTTVLFKTPGIKITQDGGITVQEDGEYFISFDGTFTTAAGRVITFSIFTPNFSGTALSGAGVATLAELVCLRAGDTVYVTVTSNVSVAALTITGILVVAKVED
ncbi:hypothetical protein [Priestia megaterium]|uniref:hypothetical protein n=1 Tax=Priestia megaterium TaxID=1404 RepID=UPI00278126DF|nr:hypothetical protein [Priestia megaterium]MDQ0804737.1 hypothetical protein [Priestia megaterium]